MMKKYKSIKGITLIALIITIIVLLILAGVTIASLTGENGLLNKVVTAKNNTEIASEKEMIQLSVIHAMSESSNAELTETGFDEALKRQIGEEKYKLAVNDDKYIVTYVDTKRRYEIDGDGNVDILEMQQVKDKTPGDYTNGGKQDGTTDNPYEIQSIEDLIAFANATHNDTLGIITRMEKKRDY